MAKTIVVGGRYFDKETGEYILIEKFTDEVVVYVFESDGESDTWDARDWKNFASCLVPANDIAVSAERGMEIKVKKLHEDAIIPEYKTIGAAGFDLHITEDVTIPANKIIIKSRPISYEDRYEEPSLSGLEFELSNDNHAVVGTGLAFEIPVGYEMEIRSRSGNVFKDIKVFAYNGTIDSDYRGEVKILLTNLGKQDVTFKKGERVAQGILKRIEQAHFVEAEELSETDRGTGGFGSTGRM